MFLVVFSLNAHALTTDRTLPTMYKITGDVNVSGSSFNYFYLVAYVTSNGNNYAIGKSACKSETGFKQDLSDGIFIGPIGSDIAGYTSKSISVKLGVRGTANLSQCTTNYNAVSLETGNTYAS